MLKPVIKTKKFKKTAIIFFAGFLTALVVLIAVYLILMLTHLPEVVNSDEESFSNLFNFDNLNALTVLSLKNNKNQGYSRVNSNNPTLYINGMSRDSRLYIQPKTAITDYINSVYEDEHYSAIVADLQVIASQSRAMWLLPYDQGAIDQLRGEIKSSELEQAIPVVVIYGGPTIVCEEYEENREAIRLKYLNWITEVKEALGDSETIVILEPDVNGLSWCLFREPVEENLMSLAVQMLKTSPNLKVYIDAGHAYWVRLDEMIGRLKNSNIEAADGFALNVSNTISTADSIKYGEQLSTALNGKHFVIDTSRNGNGPAPDFNWCNPVGRALGDTPTFDTAHPLVDAYLWIKQPGESDGTCNGGVPEGQFWPEYAVDLVRNMKSF